MNGMNATFSCSEKIRGENIYTLFVYGATETKNNETSMFKFIIQPKSTKSPITNHNQFEKKKNAFQYLDPFGGQTYCYSTLHSNFLSHDVVFTNTSIFIFSIITIFTATPEPIVFHTSTSIGYQHHTDSQQFVEKIK